MNEYYLLQDTILFYNSVSTSAHDEIDIDTITYVKSPYDSTISLSEDIKIPLSIICGHSSLESIVVYLKDNLQLKLSQIAKMLNRDQRTIWVTYSNASKKGITSTKLDISNKSSLYLPLSIFYSRDFSILENIVLYLRTTHSLSFNQISDLIGKNYQTIVTVYRRALRKMGKEKIGRHEL